MGIASKDMRQKALMYWMVLFSPALGEYREVGHFVQGGERLVARQDIPQGHKFEKRSRQ